MSTTTTTTTARPATVPAEPSPGRLHGMRAGYLFLAAGLAAVKWPLLPDAHTLPLYEGVTLCLLTALSLLAIVGLRHPVTMLPLLLLEVTWKVLWLALVAVPLAVTDDVDQATRETVVNCALVVVIIAVVPWRYVWCRLVRGPGDRWR